MRSGTASAQGSPADRAAAAVVEPERVEEKKYKEGRQGETGQIAQVTSGIGSRDRSENGVRGYYGGLRGVMELVSRFDSCLSMEFVLNNADVHLPSFVYVETHLHLSRLLTP